MGVAPGAATLKTAPPFVCPQTVRCLQAAPPLHAWLVWSHAAAHPFGLECIGCLNPRRSTLLWLQVGPRWERHRCCRSRCPHECHPRHSVGICNTSLPAPHPCLMLSCPAACLPAHPHCHTQPQSARCVSATTATRSSRPPTCAGGSASGPPAPAPSSSSPQAPSAAAAPGSTTQVGALPAVPCRAVLLCCAVLCCGCLLRPHQCRCSASMCALLLSCYMLTLPAQIPLPPASTRSAPAVPARLPATGCLLGERCDGRCTGRPRRRWAGGSQAGALLPLGAWCLGPAGFYLAVDSVPRVLQGPALSALPAHGSSKHTSTEQ